MDDRKIEHEADEAYVEFRKAWPAIKHDSVEESQVEIWHHAWRAAISKERERCARLCEAVEPDGMLDMIGRGFAENIRGQR